MGYNPFDFLGTDKRKRVSSDAMGIASDTVTEQKVREAIRNLLKKELLTKPTPVEGKETPKAEGDQPKEEGSQNNEEKK